MEDIKLVPEQKELLPGETCERCGQVKINVDGVSQKDQVAIQEQMVGYVKWFREKYGPDADLWNKSNPYH